MNSNKHQKEKISHNLKIYKHNSEKPGNLSDMHFHEHIEIFYCFGGKFSFSLSNEQFEVQKGDIIIANSEQPHATKCIETSENSGYYTIQVQPSMLYENTEMTLEFKYLQPFFSKTLSSRTKIPATEQCAAEIGILTEKIYDAYQNKDYGYEFAIKANLYNIFYILLRHWKELGVNTNFDSEKYLILKIQNVLDYINNHYAEEITAEQMADVAHMSYCYFSRMFKKITKQNFSQYLINVRIMEAQKLLLTTDKSITEIALDTGFSTSSYFIKKFKKINNCAPLQFKKKFLF